MPTEELKAKLEKNPRDIVSWFHLTWASGSAVVGDADALDNARFAEWNPRPVVDYM